MDYDEFFDCGTPLLSSRSRLDHDIACFAQYHLMLAPWLDGAGLTLRQFSLAWATGYRGPKTVANLAVIAGIGTEAAWSDIRALERAGIVTLEAPPWRFETPEVTPTRRFKDLWQPNERLGRLLEDRRRFGLVPDPSRPWQGPLPRV